MFHDFCQRVTLAFGQRTHVSHDHHPRGPCCSRARISYDEPCMGVISYQKTFASALSASYGLRCTMSHGLRGRFVASTPRQPIPPGSRSSPMTIPSYKPLLALPQKGLTSLVPLQG